MRNRRLCPSGAGDQQPEEKDGEENKTGSHAVALNASERCPICLNILTLEVGFPEDCCHAFCVSCILKWSETSTSCPVDRKPFQAVYIIDSVGGCTKIRVMERRPRENSYCNQCLPYCTKCEISFRMDVNNESSSETIDLLQKNKCINNEEKSELELKSLSWANLCLTSDFMATCPVDLSKITHCVNSEEVEEENEMCLIQRKREGLTHLRVSAAVEMIESISLSAETLIHPPPPLDKYIFPISPFSIRNKGFCDPSQPDVLCKPAQYLCGNFQRCSNPLDFGGVCAHCHKDIELVCRGRPAEKKDHRNLQIRDFSKRTCVHSSAQEGTEKKQAASGASNSRGTRKKPVQSSTRRRSTRNSKSDVSQLQSSPKSSSSDHDTLGCNTSSTNTSEHPGKQPAKQRKRAPKKRSQVRKRLRSATHAQEESNESKENSESESEQEEKKCKMPEDDLSGTEQYETNVPATKSTESGYQDVDDDSQPSSPVEQSDEKHLSVSSPIQNMQCVDEVMPSPDLQSRHPFNREPESSSPVLKNGQATLGDSPPASLMQNESDRVEIAKEQLGTEEEHPLESENLHGSEAEDSPSYQVSGKHTDSDNADLSPSSSGRIQQSDDKESACSPASETEFTVHKHLLTSVSSKEVCDSSEQDTSDIRQIHSVDRESSKFSQFKNGQHSPFSPAAEDDVKSCKAEESMDSENLCDLKHSAASQESIKEPEAQDIKEVQNMEPPVLEDSLNPDHGHDKQANGLEVSLQARKLEECIEERDGKTCIPCESDHTNSTDTSVNRKELLEQSLALTKSSATEGFCDVDETQANRLCSDEIQSPFLGYNVLKSLPEPSSDVDGKIQVTDDEDGKIPDVKNETQKSFCEDNIESVAMECDSVCSDHNESEIEHSAEIIETARTESDSLVSKNSEALQSPSKQSVALGGDAPKKESRARKSRFHSPSITWSPTKSDVKERQRSRSRSKARESPVKRKSRSRSRDRDGDRNHGQWKGRSRDRRNRRQSRSRSRSGSRTRNRNRSNTTERSEKDCSSPPWKERRSNDNWKSPRGSERYRRNEHEKPNEHFRNEKYDARDTVEQYPENKNDYPDWVVEKIKSVENRGRGDVWTRGDSRGRGDRGWGDTRSRGDGRGRGENRARGDHRGDFRGRGDRGNRGRGSPRGSHWEDSQYSSGDTWNRNVNMEWNSPRGCGGHGRGGFGGGFSYGDQNENSWNSRQPYSGNSNTSGQESSRFPEHKNYKLKYEDSFESPTDRSGWSSASSWAVRKTLPADVQNYYSKRGRNSTGAQPGWPKQEESQDQDQAIKDQPSQQNESSQIPVNMVQPQMNVVQQPMNAPPQPMNAPPLPMNAPPQPMNAPPQPMNAPPPTMNAPPPTMNAPPQPMNMFPYSVGIHPPLVNIQHNPYNLHPPLPIHLHPALPLVQVSAPSSVPQGLPPPPPPPPPSQQVNYVAPQQDYKPPQGNPSAFHVSNNLSAPLLPAPTAAQGIVGTVLGPSSGSVATSSHSKNSHVSVKSSARKESITVEASADSSKKEKKFQIQEKAAHEVKMAIRPYYQNKDITKEEYKEIVKKAVDKVCHSKSGEVDSAKVANLVKAYVDKYKHSRKKGTDDKL